MAIDMGAYNVPDGGIYLNGQTYIRVRTGSVMDSSGNNDGSHDYAVLTKFNETTETFTSGRTMSSLPGGHFVTAAMYEAPTGTLGNPAPVLPEQDVVIFGIGAYRARNSSILSGSVRERLRKRRVDASGTDGAICYVAPA